MIDLSNLPKTTQQVHRRVGRGEGSNRGKNAGKGHKGQNKHGQGTRFGFEGGQKSILRRTPKFRGFKAQPRKDLAILNLGVLEREYETGDTVTILSLQSKGLVTEFVKKVRIVNTGKLTKSLKFEEGENIYLTKGAKSVVTK